MKNKITILLLLFSSLTMAQDAFLAPSVSFGYSIGQTVFLAKNNGLELKRHIALPEVYLGGMIGTKRWIFGFNYGILQKSILLTTSVRLNIKIK